MSYTALCAHGITVGSRCTNCLGGIAQASSYQHNVLDRQAKGRSQALFQCGHKHFAFKATPEIILKMIELRNLGKTQIEISQVIGMSRSRVAAILLQKGLSYGKGNQYKRHLAFHSSPR